MCASYNLNKTIHKVLVNIREHFCLTKSEVIDCLFVRCEQTQDRVYQGILTSVGVCERDSQV